MIDIQKVINIVHICKKIVNIVYIFTNVYNICHFFCVYNINLYYIIQCKRIIFLYFKLTKSNKYCTCKDQIWDPEPRYKWTLAQKAQNNEFIENGLENWVLVNQTTSQVGLMTK